MSDPDRANPDLEALCEQYQIPASMLRRILEGYLGRSPAISDAEAAAGPGAALRMAMVGTGLRALVDQRTRFDVAPYARDRFTRRLPETLGPWFGPGLWFPCASGTAATATAVCACVGSGPAAMFAEDIGHSMTLEAGAISTMSGGRVIPVRVATDERGVMRPRSLTAALLLVCPTATQTTLGRDHFVRPGVVLLSWPSVFGFAMSSDELRAIRDICHDHHMALVLDLVWGLHKAAEHDHPEQVLRDVTTVADAVTISLPKIDCGPGAFVFFPRAEAKLQDRISVLVKSLGGMQFEAWDAAARWEAAWISQRALLWSSLRHHNARAARIRASLGLRGLRMAPASAGNMVFFSAPAALSDQLAERGTTRWPISAADPDEIVHRLAIASWYRPGWEDTLLDGIATP